MVHVVGNVNYVNQKVIILVSRYLSNIRKILTIQVTYIKKNFFFFSFFLTRKSTSKALKREEQKIPRPFLISYIRSPRQQNYKGEFMMQSLSHLLLFFSFFFFLFFFFPSKKVFLATLIVLWVVKLFSMAIGGGSIISFSYQGWFGHLSEQDNNEISDEIAIRRWWRSGEEEKGEAAADGRRGETSKLRK